VGLGCIPEGNLRLRSICYSAILHMAYNTPQHKYTEEMPQ